MHSAVTYMGHESKSGKMDTGVEHNLYNVQKT